MYQIGSLVRHERRQNTRASHGFSIRRHARMSTAVPESFSKRSKESAGEQVVNLGKGKW